MHPETMHSTAVIFCILQSEIRNNALSNIEQKLMLKFGMLVCSICICLIKEHLSIIKSFILLSDESKESVQCISPIPYKSVDIILKE